MTTIFANSWKKYAALMAIIIYIALAAYLFGTSDGGDADRMLRPGTKRLVMAVPASIKTSEIYLNKIREFEKENPDISVKLMEISGSYYQKILVMIAGNVAPDLMWMGQSFSEFADRDVFLDINGRIENSGIDIDKYYPSILELYRRDGKLYSLPFGVDASFMVYNRKLFRDAGLPYPTDDWDYKTFLAAAKKLTTRDSEDRVTCRGFMGLLPLEVFGASIFDPETGRVTCNTPEMINFFQINLNLINKYRINTNPNEESPSQTEMNLGAFRQGRIAMMVMKTMRWERAFELFKDVDWGITVCPKVKTFGQWASSQAICIYRGTKYPDEAWRLSKTFQDRDFQTAMSTRMIPGRRDIAMEMIDEAAARPDRPKNFVIMKRITELLKPTPRVPHLQELMAVLTRFSGIVFAGEMSPEEGMAACEAEMNRRVAKFGKR